MKVAHLSLREDYWESFDFQEKDLEFIINYLLDIETPQTVQELLLALINKHIGEEKESLQNQYNEIGTVYYPKDNYNIGETLLFPALQWKKGQVVNVRPGINPEMSPFNVIEVVFDDREKRSFAAGLENHILNKSTLINIDDPCLDLEYVQKKYGQKLILKLTESLNANSDLVQIAGRWFSRDLLVNIDIGYLNLAEALLDMEKGGPLSTQEIITQIELPTDVNKKLTEFSLNLALQEDDRFDEVGPSGKVLWYLNRLEPESVRTIPFFLRYQKLNYDHDQIISMISMLDEVVNDELQPGPITENKENELTFSLIYPHWRAGTLPLSNQIHRFFPSAYEAPRVRFNFVDGVSGEKFSGWVARQLGYVYGLREWYESQNLIPGSLVNIMQGKKSGEVIIKAEKHRPTREWIRTVLVGADGKIVFAMLKQLIHADYNDRMVISILDVKAIDEIWKKNNRNKNALENTVISIMSELAKLTPQGHVHAQELYAAMNVVCRCPPGPIISILANHESVSHLGDLYFSLDKSLRKVGDYE